MILEAIKNQPGLNYIECPKWVDLLAHTWLMILTFSCWLDHNSPKVQVYTLTRYDLARRAIRRHFTLCPLAAAFISAFSFFLWLHWAYRTTSYFIERGGGLCPA